MTKFKHKQISIKALKTEALLSSLAKAKQFKNGIPDKVSHS